MMAAIEKTKSVWPSESEAVAQPVVKKNQKAPRVHP
jgi:hypothetical protein